MARTNEMEPIEFEAKLKKLLLKALHSRCINLAEIVAINHHTMCAVVEILKDRVEEEGYEL